MPNNEQLQHLTQQIADVLRTAGTATTLEVCDQRAAQIAATWAAFTSQHSANDVRTLGTQLSSEVEAPAISAIGRVLSAADPTSDVWSYLDHLIEGFVTGVKERAQPLTPVDLQATQQREDQLRAVIQELSTPIIPIYSGVLVLPLVGTIDSMRSQEITERLLEEIVKQQADMVIIDITGVSVVDTSVANHLIMTAQAVSLLGSRVIFTGISSTIAQTIVQLGVNLGDVITLSNLQAGMLYALEQLGLEVTQLTTA